MYFFSASLKTNTGAVTFLRTYFIGVKELYRIKLPFHP